MGIHICLCLIIPNEHNYLSNTYCHKLNINWNFYLVSFIWTNTYILKKVLFYTSPSPTMHSMPTEWIKVSELCVNINKRTQLNWNKPTAASSQKYSAACQPIHTSWHYKTFVLLTPNTISSCTKVLFQSDQENPPMYHTTIYSLNKGKFKSSVYYLADSGSRITGQL